MKILMIGCGKMGFALLEAILKNKFFNIKDITVVKPTPLKQKIKNLKVLKNISLLPQNFQADLIIYAVKPFIMEDVLKESKHLIKTDGFIISVAAGKTVKDFEKILKVKTAIVRAMPNLPVSVGQGVTGLYANKNIRPGQKKICEEIFKFSGINFWLKKETDINKIIGVAGSSPAYIYAFTIALENVCAAYGFNKKDSALIAKQILTGSAKLIEQTKLTPQQLNKNIATPGGTTQAALDVLAKNKALDKLVKSAADAAKNRFK